MPFATPSAGIISLDCCKKGTLVSHYSASKLYLNAVTTLQIAVQYRDDIYYLLNI